MIPETVIHPMAVKAKFSQVIFARFDSPATRSKLDFWLKNSS